MENFFEKFKKKLLTSLQQHDIIRMQQQRLRGEKMSAMKKGTKLTDKPKDYMLRVRLDRETVEKLDAVCKNSDVSRSEAVRNGIEEQYQKIKK